MGRDPQRVAVARDGCTITSIRCSTARCGRCSSFTLWLSKNAAVAEACRAFPAFNVNIKGKQRHIPVDTQVLLMHALVDAADS
jgi:hypothetical protein